MAGKEVKRGRLRRTSIKPMYDEDGGVAGYTASAEHEPEPSSDGKYQGYPSDIETPHETYEGAEAKVREHHEASAKRFGGKKAKKGGPESELSEGPVRAAMGRKR